MSKLYVFVDESGGFQFNPQGSKIFVLTALSSIGIPEVGERLYRLKHQLWEQGINLRRFHASEDQQTVRDRAYDVLSKERGFDIDAVIVEKAKTHPALHSARRFYPLMFRILLQHVIRRHERTQGIDEVFCVADPIGTKKERKAVEKGLKTTLSNELVSRFEFRVLHLDSFSEPCLQAADYCCWAIYKKWRENELRPYNKIKHAVKSEFDVFRWGLEKWF